jgi:predicted RNase H-like nuclease (RuvC/YqgF family)
MSLHAFGAHSGRNAKAHELRTDERKVHQDVPSTADHKACLERIRDLREENELLRKSADEFAALAERLQRALVRERARGGRAGNNAQSAASDSNRILTISMQIEAEYRSIPNLRLTRWQAARLWDLDQRECDEAIAALVRNRVLRETPGGFVRREK